MGEFGIEHLASILTCKKRSLYLVDQFCIPLLLFVDVIIDVEEKKLIEIMH